MICKRTQIAPTMTSDYSMVDSRRWDYCRGQGLAEVWRERQERLQSEDNQWMLYIE